MLCELALVIAIDVSGSVSQNHYELQRNATARAIEEVVNPNQNTLIVISVVMWGDIPVVTIPWSIMRSRSDARSVSRALVDIERPVSGMTNMVRALDTAFNLLDNTPCNAERQIIDISGDGISNDGSPEFQRDRAHELGIQINGLPIVTEIEPTIVEYYRDRVITLDGFLVAANDWNDYIRAIRGKLSLEIAGTLE